jgi:hypothetical protein
MKRTLLIINANSGSANAVGEDEIVISLKSAGFQVARTLTLPEDDLPTRALVEDGDFDSVVILSGDGTISALCKALSGWGGSILPLPGGTMNLLCRKLHGDAPLPELLTRLSSAFEESAPVPAIYAAGFEVLTGLIAGPSTEWGKVREGLREMDVATLVQQVPEAWMGTVESQSVGIADREARYPAIFVEPSTATELSVIAFKADGIGDMLSHGIAWLRRDFRDGPHDDLGVMGEVTIIDDDHEVGLLVDGEQDKTISPLICRAGLSSVKFVRLA